MVIIFYFFLLFFWVWAYPFPLYRYTNLQPFVRYTILCKYYFNIFYLFSIPLPLNIHFYSNLVSMTNKKGAGGAREGAGRPPKILEIKLIEQMDAIAVPNEIWKALLYKCQEGDTAALKLWLSYRFGLPKQQIDITSNGENIAPPIQWISKNISIESAKVISEEEEEANQPQWDELQKKVQQDYQNLIDQDKENKQRDQFDIWK